MVGLTEKEFLAWSPEKEVNAQNEIPRLVKELCHGSVIGHVHGVYNIIM